MQTEWITYLRKNWFRVTLVVIFVFVAFKKDLSFQINVNTPAPSEQLGPESTEPPRRVEEGKERETLTDNLDRSTKSSTVIDRLKIPLWGEKKREAPNAFDRLGGVAEHRIDAYLKRFTHVAMSEQEKFGIPASIILGNALLGSLAGEREMAIEGNNHFALKCTEDWQGESGRYEGRCYRHYDIAWTSFRDHSLYLTTGKMARYVQALEPADYENWARVLEKAAFSEERDYAIQLIKVIEQYGLHKLDG